MKVVVTDFIEPDLNMEAERLAAQGIEFEAHQLKFRPMEDVVAVTPATPTSSSSTWCPSPGN